MKPDMGCSILSPRVNSSILLQRADCHSCENYTSQFLTTHLFYCGSVCSNWWPLCQLCYRGGFCLAHSILLVIFVCGTGGKKEHRTVAVGPIVFPLWASVGNSAPSRCHLVCEGEGPGEPQLVAAWRLTADQSLCVTER